MKEKEKKQQNKDVEEQRDDTSYDESVGAKWFRFSSINTQSFFNL